MCAGLKDNLHSLGEEFLVQQKEDGSYCYRKKLVQAHYVVRKSPVGVFFRRGLELSWCSLVGKVWPFVLPLELVNGRFVLTSAENQW